LPLQACVRQVAEESHQRAQVSEPKERAAGSEQDEGIGWGEIGPGEGKGADAASRRIGKEDPRLTPGYPLAQQRELLASQGMKGMGYRKDKISIQAIRCSRQFIQMALPKGT